MTRPEKSFGWFRYAQSSAAAFDAAWVPSASAARLGENADGDGFVSSIAIVTLYPWRSVPSAPRDLRDGLTGTVVVRIGMPSPVTLAFGATRRPADAGARTGPGAGAEASESRKAASTPATELVMPSATDFRCPLRAVAIATRACGSTLANAAALFRVDDAVRSLTRPSTAA